MSDMQDIKNIKARVAVELDAMTDEEVEQACNDGYHNNADLLGKPVITYSLKKGGADKELQISKVYLPESDGRLKCNWHRTYTCPKEGVEIKDWIGARGILARAEREKQDKYNNVATKGAVICALFKHKEITYGCGWYFPLKLDKEEAEFVYQKPLSFYREYVKKYLTATPEEQAELDKTMATDLFGFVGNEVFPTEKYMGWLEDKVRWAYMD